MTCYGMQSSNYAAGDYYRGDYYRGDYYRGDPFFHKKLLGFAGKALGGIAKIGGAVLSKTPIGAVVSTGLQLARGFAGGEEPPLMLPPPGGARIPAGLPEGMTGSDILQLRSAYAVCGPDGRPRGRWNKSTYVTRGGGTSRWPQTIIVHPKGTECVRPRRMNVANPRALRRALRRAAGFAKLARRYVAVQRRFKKGKKKRGR